jgi:hypothetical protein
MSFFFFFLFGQHLFVQKTQSLLLASALNFSFVAHLFSLTFRLRSLPNSTNISEELCAVCVSLSLSRLNSTEKERKKKRRMTALPTDQVLLLLRSCGTLFLILSLFLSYVFPSS